MMIFYPFLLFTCLCLSSIQREQVKYFSKNGIKLFFCSPLFLSLYLYLVLCFGAEAVSIISSQLAFPWGIGPYSSNSRFSRFRLINDIYSSQSQIPFSCAATCMCTYVCRGLRSYVETV